MAGRKPANPRRVQHGFVEVKYVRCPDCEYEGALRNDGGARVIGGRLKGFTVDMGVTKASSGCETCKSQGAISTKDLAAMARAGIENPRLADRDPYSLPLTPEQAARMKSARK